MQAGTRDTLIDSLPGFPDGLSRSRDGQGFWVSVVMPKIVLAKALPLPRSAVPLLACRSCMKAALSWPVWWRLILHRDAPQGLLSSLHASCRCLTGDGSMRICSSAWSAWMGMRSFLTSCAGGHGFWLDGFQHHCAPSLNALDALCR